MRVFLPPQNEVYPLEYPEKPDFSKLPKEKKAARITEWVNEYSKISEINRQRYHQAFPSIMLCRLGHLLMVPFIGPTALSQHYLWCTGAAWEKSKQERIDPLYFNDMNNGSS